AGVVRLVAGAAVRLAAYALNELTADRNIMEMMPRSFNCFLMPLGLLFLFGIFAPFAGPRAAVVASLVALTTAVGIAYAKPLFGLEKDISFTWVLPGARVVGAAAGLLVSWFGRPQREQVAGLTWFTRRQVPLIDHRLFAEWVIEESKQRQGHA